MIMPAEDHAAAEVDAVEMPRPTAAPLVLSLGLALLALGWATSSVFIATGGVLLALGLARWIAELLPGRGHEHMALVPAGERVEPPRGEFGRVQSLRAGVPGYRIRLPERVHPISAGIKGGIVGGLLMPFPALLYGLLSGYGIWYPVNLLAGMALPGVGEMTSQQLEAFHPSLFGLAVATHVTMSVVLGLIYGVLLPTLPPIAKPLAWGGLLMPLLWSGLSFLAMGQVNPVLQQRVDWPWFILSQFLFGVVAALVVMSCPRWPRVAAGLLGGLVGGLLMSVPAVVWSVAAGYGPWYPINLLTAMVQPGMDHLPTSELERFHAEWLLLAVGIHAAICAGFGLVYGILLTRLPRIEGAVAWGGLLMPLLWTAVSYGLMGVINPVLQHRVDWAWFIVSQFVYGLATAWVVYRSEKIHIPPAGRGDDDLKTYVEGHG